MRPKQSQAFKAYTVGDSDGNVLSTHDNACEAYQAALVLVRETWGAIETASIAGIIETQRPPQDDGVRHRERRVVPLMRVTLAHPRHLKTGRGPVVFELEDMPWITWEEV